jgi:uncharacterized membrane protein HdeD (DUF308 family)
VTNFPAASTKRPSGWPWRVALVRGLAALAIGVVVLVTRETKSALVNMIAIYWLIGSVLTLRWAFRSPGKGRVGAIVAGVLGFAAGSLVLLRFALHSAVALPVARVVLGSAAIATGAFRVAGAFRDPEAMGGRVSIPRRAPLGFIEMALGALLLAHLTSTRPVAIVAGVWGFAAGIILLMEAAAIRNRSKRFALSDLAPPTTNGHSTMRTLKKGASP